MNALLAWYLGAWAHVDLRTTHGQVLAVLLAMLPVAVGLWACWLLQRVGYSLSGGQLAARDVRRVEQGRRDWSATVAVVLLVVLAVAVFRLYAGGSR